MISRLQSNAVTKAKQLDLWVQLMQDRFSGFYISLTEPYSLFKNAEIKRELNESFISALCEHLRDRKLGDWLSREEKSIFLFYRFPIGTWAEKVHAWAVKTGKINSIESAYSIVHGNDSSGEVFAEIPHEILINALKALELQGKCELVMSYRGETDITKIGVKFFH